MFTFMPHIMAKFTKYIVRTFLVENPDTGQKYSFCNSDLKSSYQMQFSDIRNKVVDLILLQQLTSKVKQFYRDQIRTISFGFWDFGYLTKTLITLKPFELEINAAHI